MKKLLLNNINLEEESFIKNLNTILSKLCTVVEDNLDNSKDYNVILSIEALNGLKEKGSNCFIVTTNPYTTIKEMEVEFKNQKTMYSKNDRFVHVILDKDFLYNNKNKIYLAINSYIKHLLGIRATSDKNGKSYIVLSSNERENIFTTPIKEEAFSICNKYQNAKVLYDGDIVYKSTLNLVKVNMSNPTLSKNLGKNIKKSGYQVGKTRYRKTF